MARASLFLTVVLLGVAGVLFEGASAQSVATNPAYCAIYGDPHLKPFSQSNTYFCQTPGWVLLLSNPYVAIYVQVSSTSSKIIDVSSPIQMLERHSVSMIVF